MKSYIKIPMENSNNRHFLTLRELQIIKKIESYGARYDPTSGLSLEDQLLACEAVAEATPVDAKNWERQSDIVLSGNENATYYRRVNPTLPPDYLQAIQRLKQCDYKTPPVEVSVILEQIFGPSGKEGHWLWIAQHYNPRPIIQVLTLMQKQTIRGEITIYNPPAYFTKILNLRKKRKKYKKTD